MKRLKSLSVGTIVLFVLLWLPVVSSNRAAQSSEKHYTFSQMVSAGDRIVIDTLEEGVRLIVAPDDSYWQESQNTQKGSEHGVITGVYEDYISVRVVYEVTTDPLAPQGKTRFIHLPFRAIARITTFADTRF